MRKRVYFIGCAICALLVGCVEQETTVSIPTSAVAKVSSGQIEYVKADYIFGYESKGDDDKMLRLMRELRRVMKRHLGKGGEIKVERDAYGYWFKASFRVPFGKESALDKAQKSIMVLVMGADGKIELRDGPGLALLNRDLEGSRDLKERFMNFLDSEESAGSIIQWANTLTDWKKAEAEKICSIGCYDKLFFRFTGGHNLTPKIIEAPTDNTPIKVGLVGNGFADGLFDHIIVEFNRRKDESFWHSRTPFVFLQVDK